jgi:hypothetical protein
MNTASSIDRSAAAVANQRTMRADYSLVFDALMTVAAADEIKARTYLINGWHPIWGYSRTYFPNWA